jgi:hypothetical protein
MTKAKYDLRGANIKATNVDINDEQVMKTKTTKIKWTVGELLDRFVIIKNMYVCVSDFTRSLEIAYKVLNPLETTVKQYQDKIKIITGSSKSDMEKMNMIDDIRNQEVEVDFIKVQKKELEDGAKAGFIRVNPVFLNNIKDLMED